MQFTDAVTVEGKPRRTADGYLVATAKSVRTGIQLYAGSEVGVTDKAVVRVYRPPEEVFADASLQSFTHAPVTVDHPKEMVTADNWKDLAVGEVSTAAKKDGEWVHLPLILKDAAAIHAVETGKRELSAGYVCSLDFTPGTTPAGETYDAVQRGIKINHLALVDRARAGSQARIGDGAISWGASPVITPTADEKGSPMADNLRKVLVDGLQVETTDAGAAAIDKLTADKAAIQKKMDDAQADHAKAIEAKDTEIGTLKADLKKAQDAAIKPADLDKMVADRAALVATVKAVDSKIVVDGKTDAELRKAAVAAKLGDEMVKDASDAEVAGMFKAIAKDAKPADPFSEVVKDGLHQTGDARVDAAKARTDHINSMRDAWKGEPQAKH